MIQNAVITDVSLSIADHGCLSGWLNLNYGGSGQGFGGYSLYSVGVFNRNKGGNFAGLFITRILEVVGVEKWEDLKGKPCRVDAEHNGVKRLGHFIEEKWFDPKVEFTALENS